MKCDNCKNDFSYSSILKSFWIGYTNIKCAQCGAIYEHKMFNRLLGAIIIGIPFLLIQIFFVDTDITYKVIGYISIAFILSLLYPQILKFNRIK
jgi:CXXC-20-CXXC protein